MDTTTLENRIQAAYEAGVRDGREEGYLEGVSSALHRLSQIERPVELRLVAAACRPARNNVVPFRNRAQR